VTPLARRRALLVSSFLLAATAAACGTDPSTRSSDDSGTPAPTAAATTVGSASTAVHPPTATVPPGTTLRLGDQLDYLSTVLSLGGQDADLPYDLELASFVGGPPMLQAFQGGALDAGFVASTPLLFAQAAGQDIAAVAGWATENGSSGLVTSDPEINGWADLKGKRVAFQRGTSAQSTLIVGLDSVGLSYDDVTPVDVAYIQVTATLAAGAADAGISAEPLISAYIAEHPDARVVERPNDITDTGSFLIASADALDDPAKEAALADLSTRLVRSFAHLREHPELTAGLYADRYGLSIEAATALNEATGPTRFITLPDEIIEQQQRLAELLVAAGELPDELDVGPEFDSRFAAVIAAAGAGS
jgi:sulfonate transport system substrate-binding protein